jgi:hypothetical protein
VFHRKRGHLGTAEAAAEHHGDDGVGRWTLREIVEGIHGRGTYDFLPFQQKVNLKRWASQVTDAQLEKAQDLRQQRLAWSVGMHRLVTR